MVLRFALSLSLLLSIGGCEPDPIPLEELVAEAAADMTRQELAPGIHLELPPDSTFEERTHSNKHWRSYQRGWGQRHVTAHVVEYELPGGVVSRLQADRSLLQRYVEGRHGAVAEQREGNVGEPPLATRFTRFTTEEADGTWYHEAAVFRSGRTVMLLAMAGPTAYSGEVFERWIGTFSSESTEPRAPHLTPPWSPTPDG